MKDSLKKSFIHVSLAFVSIVLIFSFPAFINATNHTTHLPFANLAEQSPTPTSIPTFSDLDLTTEQGQAMQKLVELGVIEGYPDGMAKPNETITREQAAKILTLLTRKNPDFDFETSPFKDVSNSSWAYNFILFSYDYGYIQGTPELNFLPSNTLTRGQMAVILNNFFYYEAPIIAVEFDDVLPTDYYYDAVSNLIAHGITKGTSTTQFSPNAGVTRGQLAVFFDRSGLLDELLELQKGIPWDDIPSEWTDGDHYDIYSFFGIHMNSYFEKNGLNNQYIMIDYGYLGSDYASDSFIAYDIPDGSVIPIPHLVYNHYFNTYTEFTILVEIENGEISRFKVEKPEEILANYHASTGLKELQEHIEYFKVIHNVANKEYEEGDYYSLYPISEDLRYEIVQYDDVLHFTFPDEKAFYAVHSANYGHDFEILKITPVLKKNGYDITFEVASPSYVLTVENKNNRNSEQVYLEENYLATIEKIDGKLIYINLYADADTNDPIEEGTSITVVLYDAYDVYNDYDKVIGYDWFEDYFTYVWKNGKWDLVFEHTEAGFVSIDADDYYENYDNDFGAVSFGIK